MNKFTMKLWEQTPHYIEGEEIPTLTYYPAKCKRGRGTVIICPGGGYTKRAGHEGADYALYLNGLGLDAFVLDYRIYPYEFPCQLLDARRAVRLVRSRASDYGIDPERIAVMGSSAGGHLTAMLSSYRGVLDGEGIDEIDGIDFRPSGQILCYPVTERDYERDSYCILLGERLGEMYESVVPRLIADSDTPPAFIWHSAADALVGADHTLSYATRLIELGVPVELHVFPYGRHGMGLCTGEEDEHTRSWSGLLAKWLRLMGYLDE